MKEKLLACRKGFQSTKLKFWICQTKPSFLVFRTSLKSSIDDKVSQEMGTILHCPDMRDISEETLPVQCGGGGLVSKPSYEALISGYSFLVLERVIISMDIEPLLTESVIGTNNYLRKAGGSQLLLCE